MQKQTSSSSSSSSSSIIFLKLITFTFIFNCNFNSTLSFPSFPSNITLFGDAYLIKNSKFNFPSISLTKQHPSSSGRAFYSHPIQFLDTLTNSTLSFSARFSFMITPSSVSTPGDGIAFLITSNMGKFGHLGMPEFRLNSRDSFVAVEFDTKFDAFVGDISGNHVGLNVNSYDSLVSVDGILSGVDFGNGKRVNAWVEYRNSVEMISVWVSYFPNKPLVPVLSAHIDLSKHMKEFMYVGFSAANGNGCAMHVVDGWEFKAFEFDFGSVSKVEEDKDCVNCFKEAVVSDVEYKKRNKKLDVAILEITIASCLLISIVVGYIIWRFRKYKESKREKKRRVVMEKVPAKLCLSEIKAATKGFCKSKIIGEGTSATIYKGILFHKQVVAVKRFSCENRSHVLKPFTTEFATMVQTLKHKNLVQLLGWCCEDNELILVYEFLPNGSLDQVLHNASDNMCVLTWEQRLNIVLGIASCLTYLHEECNKQIIHRDVKARNVILDSDFTPKLCDFGFAEVYDRDSRSRKPTIPAGTMGYLAPEYVYSGVPTVKSDVYSFGIVVLEVVSGRKPVEDKRNSLIDWVWSLLEAGKLIEAVDPRMMGRYSTADMERMLRVGLCCVHFDTNRRLTIKEAAKMLRGEMLVPVLPAKRPVVMVQNQGVLPRALKKILIKSEGDDNFSECFWSSPRTQFSED